ncbi:hypothetical protein FOA52_007933 [Chlamydomonas sp. UWO 241]|nr:hypothetical protein FOA52_007933 [Chlamydomonas sp. UWO 241]
MNIGARDAKLNFPGKLINEALVSLGDERKQRKTSAFVGVSFHNTSSAWKAQLWVPETKRKRHIGSYASEVEAAWAHDVAAVKQDLGVPNKKLNFPIQARASLLGQAPQWLLDGKAEPEQP